MNSGERNPMSSVIKEIEKGSLLEGRNIRTGDVLFRINGHKIRDVLDYKYYTYESRLLLEVHDKSGKIRFIRVNKPEGAELGLEFESYLMDSPRACANKCVFCFVDQLPKNLRETLYFKDDDVRLSFLQGNYVTLTNLSEREVQRIIDMRLSPLNISVHSTEPELHSLLLGHRNSIRALKIIQRFAAVGLRMNCQIVCCPGLNDKEHLNRTMQDLADLFPAVQSVSVVPVGLTKYRENLAVLQPFDKDAALRAVYQVETFGEKCLKQLGTRFVFSADELYLKAGLDIPDEQFYEGYPQLENGVGLLRLLLSEAEEEIQKPHETDGELFSIATGKAAYKCLQNIFDLAQDKCVKINCNLYEITNNFFGETVDVAGLLTGGDLVSQLKGKELGKRLLIAKNMLRHGETVFLDDMTLEEVSRELGVPIRVVEQDGADLVRAMFGN